MMLTCKRNQKIVKKLKEDLLNTATVILNVIFKKIICHYESKL